VAQINCAGLTTRQINAQIKQFSAAGEKEITVRQPGARHNLGVAVLEPVRLVFAGSVGYYCAGLIDGPTVEIEGSAGWGLAESMKRGTVRVRGHAGNGAAASMRGGTVIIHGHAAARLGVALKGGLVVVGGNCGYMAGFMGQKGMLIVCGDAGEAFADSMYETTCFVGGRLGGLGNDAVVEEPTEAEWQFLRETLARHLPEKQGIATFKKVVAGRKLWNFDKQERVLWREVL
jgi:glutamate synthase domain-containing protein 3